ncbi:MAG: hypothetical protein ACI9XO_004414 [Paraglaciecola sp.]|jgi:hypothetical protein
MVQLIKSFLLTLHCIFESCYFACIRKQSLFKSFGKDFPNTIIIITKEFSGL